MARRLAAWSSLFLTGLLLLLSACGGSSSSSGGHKNTPTPTPTPTATPIANVQVQAPINGVVAILGAPGVAPGGGTVSGSSSSSAGFRQANAVAAGSSGCSASGSASVHPDGSFSLAVCAGVGDHVNLSHTTGGSTTSLGFVVVPSTTSLPTCPTGFRTFKYTNTTSNTVWLGLVTGGGPPPVACAVSNANSCGPNQTCVATSACTSFTQCADANQCDTNTGVCMEAPSTVCAGGAQSTTVTLSQNECVGRLGAACTSNSQCDTNFTCDTTTGLCTTTVSSLQNNTSCSTAANCGSSTSCTWTNQVSECTGGSCFFAPVHPGETQACQSDSDCTISGQTCDTNMGLCQYSSSTIPQNDLELSESSTTVLCLPGGVAPGSFWAGPGKITNTSTLCTEDSQCASGRCVISGTSGPFAPHVPPTATDCSQAQEGQTCTCFPIIGWSGNSFARTGCQSDGTMCQTGDCGNSAYQGCPVGGGGLPPDTLAEFTLSANAVDFYDVSVINGANVAVQMGPDPSSTASPSPGTTAYQCETAGSTSAQPASGGGLSACSWNFNLASVPTFGDETSLLTQVSLPSCNPNSAGCPAGSACQPTGVDPTTKATTYTCIPNQPACTTSSDCPGSLPCVNGFCAPTTQCTSSSQCPNTAPSCVQGLCLPDTCTTDSDCSSAATGLESATCQNGTCTPLTCDATVTCPAGFSCNIPNGQQFGTCVSSQASCSATQPCPNSHQVCDIPSGMATGTCVAQLQCPVDGSCPLNSLCGAGGYCVPGPLACPNSGTCPNGQSCSAGSYCTSPCTADSDCSSVSGTCNTTTGQCQPLGCDGNVSCPSGMACSGSGTCVDSCSSATDCSSSAFGATCGTGLVGGNLLQTCGSATGGLWTYDDFCGQAGQKYGPVDCTATAQSPPSGTPDTIANMFGCNGNAVGSATSCYNTAAANSFCCGCPTATGVASDWPTILGSSFTNCTDSSTAWQNDVLPWLHYLKDACPTAYSFPFDDATSTFTCASAGTSSSVSNTMNYDITFGSFQINSNPAN